MRAAREGLSVILVNWHDHLGGIMSSGLGVWDTQYEGRRSPLYDEMRQAFFDFYRRTYGDDSPQYRDALPGTSGYNNGRFEPHVAERHFTDLVEREEKIIVLRGKHLPADHDVAAVDHAALPERPERDGLQRGAVPLDAHGHAAPQHDAMLAPGLGRAPVHADSIAVTEWYMDAHGCTTARVLGSMDEGKAMLHQETFPGRASRRAA